MRSPMIDAMDASTEELTAAQEWLADCGVDVLDLWYADEIVREVNARYEGGWAAFLRDGVLAAA